MAEGDGDGAGLEGVGGEDELCHHGTAGGGGRLVEDEVAEAVEDGDGNACFQFAHLLYDVGVVADDGVAAGAGEGGGSEALAHGRRVKYSL